MYKRQGLAYAGGQFLAVEHLAALVLLDDNQVAGMDSLVGGEPEATAEALATTADGIIHIPGIGNFGVFVIAMRTLHHKTRLINIL